MNTDNAPIISPETGQPPRNMKKIAAASVIGTTVEWYDLFISPRLRPWSLTRSSSPPSTR
ncbi:hypothetical protein AB4Z48_37010 [Cupriavidus sp. 2TAF22]|uniref:hypothetical protein n=1 Tax=unclassified Cupriavidus TaxID=2640874 RepID=UPI003F913E4E